jgi:hypothetical protein
LEREVSIDCPSDCEFLKEARLREHPTPPPDESIPNRDIHINEDFLREHEPLVIWISEALARAMEREKAVDQDAREALDAMIQTYRTLESGLIYESRPANPYAAALQEALKHSIEKLRQQLTEVSAGVQSLRDADILKVLVFLEHVELQYANGRRRGRAFYDFLNTNFPAMGQSAGEAAEKPLVSL